MIGTSLPEYLFIRVCIFFLHWIAPLSVAYCVVAFVLQIPHYRTFWILEALVVAEAAFYICVYLPRRLYLQRAAIHPAPLTREKRQELFRTCHERVSDPDSYLSKWFLDAPLAEIKRENVKDFLRWAFLNKEHADPADDEELEQYIGEFEELLSRKFEVGRGRAKCLLLTLDPVDMLHRSVTWYMCVGFVDFLTSFRMRYHGFHFHRTAFLQTLSIFPPRPIALLTPYQSAARTLPYWHRPHTSRTKLPILFIHGIGIGLYPYVNFLTELNMQGGLETDDEEVGIIAVELMPVSFRITHAALGKEEMCEEIRSILADHGWDQFVLVSHSYGSVVSTHLLHTPLIAEKIKGLLLIDPITFLLHVPDVAYNFTYRKPIHANEHQLYYFASKDMGVSHTLSRRFFWSENILWKQDLRGMPVTVSLGGRDLIVNTRAVRNYLTTSEPSSEKSKLMIADGGKEEEKTSFNSSSDWKEHKSDMDVLWFEDLDHAQVFDKRATRKRLIDVLRNYCQLS